jgi:hypothetical protein
MKTRKRENEKTRQKLHVLMFSCSLVFLFSIILTKFPYPASCEEVVAVPTQRASAPVVRLAKDAVATRVDTPIGTVNETFFAPPPNSQPSLPWRVSASGTFVAFFLWFGKQFTKQLF